MAMIIIKMLVKRKKGTKRWTIRREKRITTTLLDNEVGLG